MTCLKLYAICFSVHWNRTEIILPLPPPIICTCTVSATSPSPYGAVRRELADNFCHYSPQYDTLDGQKYDWAKDTLRLHAADARPYVYTLAQLEAGKTHDRLWNAAQLEMVHGGKMHGFMRMYWAKKILEWTEAGRRFQPLVDARLRSMSCHLCLPS